jgi:hypothetical protein
MSITTYVIAGGNNETATDPHCQKESLFLDSADTTAVFPAGSTRRPYDEKLAVARIEHGKRDTTVEEAMFSIWSASELYKEEHRATLFLGIINNGTEASRMGKFQY